MRSLAHLPLEGPCGPNCIVCNPSLVKYVKRQMNKDSSKKFSGTSRLIDKIADRDGTRDCHYCGSTKRPTVEHIVPKSLGGPRLMPNLILACGPCNNKRGNSNSGHNGCAFCEQAQELYYYVRE